MIKKRIYTDLFIRDLTFVDKTSQNIIDLTNANNIKLFVRKHGISAWIEQEKTIINNKISFQWNATENTTIGTYDVMLSYDKESTTSETGKIEYKYDAISLFQIVNTSEDELNVDGMTTVQVVYYGGSDGLSAYQLAVKHGYSGTEAEFAQIESNNADAEVDRQTSEEGRVIAEGERDNAEKARISAETSRSAAEATRAENEENRKNSETNRETNFEDAIKTVSNATADANSAAQNANTAASSANTAASNAETAATNANDTASRVAQTEDLRVTAESGRVTAESYRVAEFNTLKTASEEATDKANTAATTANWVINTMSNTVSEEEFAMSATAFIMCTWWNVSASPTPTAAGQYWWDWTALHVSSAVINAKGMITVYTWNDFELSTTAVYIDSTTSAAYKYKDGAMVALNNNVSIIASQLRGINEVLSNINGGE